MTFCRITIGDWITRTRADGFVSRFPLPVVAKHVATAVSIAFILFHFLCLVICMCMCIICSYPDRSGNPMEEKQTLCHFFMGSVRSHQIRADFFSVYAIFFNRQVQPHMHVSQWRWFTIKNNNNKKSRSKHSTRCNIDLNQSDDLRHHLDPRTHTGISCAIAWKMMIANKFD